MAVSQVKLKLLIDTHGKKVLFAEAGKDFVDFLIYLMSLPVSTIIKLLKEKGEVGCLNDLYNSLVNLNDTYIQSGLDRTTLLNHKSSLCLSGTPLLLSDAQSTSTARTVYLCRHCVARASELPNLKCPNCNYTMSTVVSIVSSTSSTTSSTSSPSKEGGFVKGVVTYMVMDNLEVTPMSTISSITMLSKFKVQNVAALKEKIVVFDVDEVRLRIQFVLLLVYQNFLM